MCPRHAFRHGLVNSNEPGGGSARCATLSAAAKTTGPVGYHAVAPRQGNTWRLAALALILSCSGCQPVRAPPQSVFFGGLPVSGNLRDARHAGFTECVDLDAVHVRCRRRGVTVASIGPYDAAVDLLGSNGEGGFDELTLWDERDNDAVFKIAHFLEETGWSKCLTGNGRSGDQAIYTRKGSPVRFSMDISYWAKRRIRVIPEWRRDYHCVSS